MSKVFVTVQLLLLAVVLELAAEGTARSAGLRTLDNIGLSDPGGRHLLAHGRSLSQVVCTYPGGGEPCSPPSVPSCCETMYSGGICRSCSHADGCYSCTTDVSIPACCQSAEG